MKRIASIDALRGLTIFGMILCAAISFDAGLPAWMFHCQTPPPSYGFHPELRGLTWVDMVFPFFIFSMGAAFPFALSRRLSGGASVLQLCLGILKRGVVLVLFALVLGNADWARSSQCGDVWVGLWRLGVWLALFAALVRTPRKAVNAAGWVSLAGLMAVQQFVLKVPLSLAHNDIIILLLAAVAVLGSFVWLLTRGRIILRFALWLVVIASKIAGLDFMQYLVIAIPASVVGDILLRQAASQQGSGLRPSISTSFSAWLCLAAVLVQLWGLYTRHVAADLCITVVLGAAFFLLAGRRGAFRTVGRMGFALLIAGIAWDPLDGGLAKDYCNLSYLLVTGGQAALTLCFLMWCESRGALSRNLSLAGQNPMIAYTAGWFVITPLLYLCGLGAFDALCSGAPVPGFVRGLVVALLTTAMACLFSRLKIFWKS